METTRNIQHPTSNIQHPARGFTLIELLVVITIIGILASLLAVAVVGALKKAQETRIKAEVNEISGGFDEYKNKTTSYPPNCQTDMGDPENGKQADITARQTFVFNDLKRHLRQAFPRHQESDELLLAILGLTAYPSGGKADTSNYNPRLTGGMSAGEALVFWLGGFSNDPKYPISGEGGPSYLASLKQQDPIETRHWIYPVDVSRLVPRDSNNYFDESVQAGQRYIVYPDPRFPQDNTRKRRINFWQYTPAKSDQPFIYFDTSRHAPAEYDPPARFDVHVHALKKILNPGATNEQVAFINPDKYQVLHCGVDNVWGEDFDRASYYTYTKDKTQFFDFPTGPFVGDVADTIVNFVTETKLEDAQK